MFLFVTSNPLKNISNSYQIIILIKLIFLYREYFKLFTRTVANTGNSQVGDETSLSSDRHSVNITHSDIESLVIANS